MFRTVFFFVSGAFAAAASIATQDAPGAEIVFPQDGRVIEADTPIALTARLDEGVEVVHARWWVDGVGELAPVTFDGDRNAALTVQFPPGEFDLVLDVVDGSGSYHSERVQLTVAAPAAQPADAKPIWGNKP